MNRIPSDLKLDEIVGSEIQQIRCGRYDVQFDFHAGVVISVQGCITLLRRTTRVGGWDDSGNWSTLEFQGLLNIPATAYKILNDRLLQIEFANGLVLQIHDSSDQYESFQISWPGTNVMLVV